MNLIEDRHDFGVKDSCNNKNVIYAIEILNGRKIRLSYKPETKKFYLENLENKFYILMYENGKHEKVLKL